jgi:arginase family enzyme
MVFDFLQPVDADVIRFTKNLSSQHFGSKIVFHSDDDFPDLDRIKIAIIGVLENRGTGHYGEPVELTSLRKELYSLFPGNWNETIADLGDIDSGNSADDTYFAVREVVAALLRKKIIPIVIGGSQDLTYALYRSYDKLEQMVNLVTIDSRFDFGKEQQAVSADSYMTRIIVDEPNNLFNFSNIGYQTYYNSQEEIDLIEKLFFDAYRLGEVSNNISVAEPVFRDADMVIFYLTSVKSSDS